MRRNGENNKKNAIKIKAMKTNDKCYDRHLEKANVRKERAKERDVI
jgi:hypothetical protein